MSPVLGSKPQRVGAVLAVVALGGIGFAPLFGGPGYEAALAAGAVLPALAASVVALDTVRSRPVPLVALEHGAATGALLAALGAVVTLAHGVRVGFCDPVEGFELYVLSPGFGSIAGGFWGAIAGLAAAELRGLRGGKLAVLLALCGPLGGIVVSLWRFYASPMVFAFDPFFGFFAGTLYDTVITGLERLAIYRVGTALTLIAALVLGAHGYRDGDGRLRLRYLGRPGVALLGLVAACGSIAITVSGNDLGHYQSAESIREELGRSAVSKRCEVVYPTGIVKRDAHALARECDAHIEQLEDYFESAAPDKTVVFVFSSPEQKGRLMGAANTYIAKPWRKEIYIQRAGYPHRVLRHELAHVVAGDFGRGPFLVSGPLGGLVPDPGRIEGVAVAAAPKEGDLTTQQWAKAMRDLELLPSLDRVFKLSFLGEPSSRAYTVAGAFIEWFVEAYGMAALKRWYGGERLASVADGKALSALERDWHAALDRVNVSERAMHVARARFDRPAIFGRRCPHVVDRRIRTANWALGQHDTDRAKREYHAALELDPHNFAARYGLGTCALREGDTKGARLRYERLAADEKLAKATRARAEEMLADLDLVSGKVADAKKRYDAVSEIVVDENHLRGLDVKRYATAREEGRLAITSYLVGEPRFGRDAAVAAAEIGAWGARESKLGLPDYLLARSYFARSRWHLAAKHMDRALEKELPLKRVAREALRTSLIVACALGDAARATALHETWSTDRAISESRRKAVASFVARCQMSSKDKE